MKRFIKYFLKYKHKDEWFKWLGWVIITVAVSAAWWKTRNSTIFIIALISLIYITHSLLMGLSTFIGGYLSHWNLEKWKINLITGFLFPLFVFAPVYVFIPLIIGLF